MVIDNFSNNIKMKALFFHKNVDVIKIRSGNKRDQKMPLKKVEDTKTMHATRSNGSINEFDNILRFS